MEQHGSDSAFRRSIFQQWLVFDERQFTRLLDIVERDCAEPETDTIGIAAMLDNMSPKWLARYRERVLALPWTRYSRHGLSECIRYHNATSDLVWDAFVDRMQQFLEVDDPDFHPFHDGTLNLITDNLLQDPRLEQWVMDVLDTPPTADDYSARLAAVLPTIGRQNPASRSW